jgi:hypothetical protein
VWLTLSALLWPLMIAGMLMPEVASSSRRFLSRPFCRRLVDAKRLQS